MKTAETIMNKSTNITAPDLTQRPPRSLRTRLGGYALLPRMLDKARATIVGKNGEYHYDCPLDNTLFSFKGITGEQFKAAVQAAKNYEDVGTWLEANGTPKTPFGKLSSQP